ncbi:MAG TPA: T9SS type A sorting domain-containing protein, partial [Candidatus Marinimicrobia bacterium]|nr:T9SS type A sorting domain-containing protein [Candidatus Neomarinimicrobiota bacterium]
GLTITGGKTEVTEGNVVVTDSAGNASTDTGKLLTIDLSPPILTSVISTKGNNILGGGHGRTAQAKSGDTFKIVASGGGFKDKGGDASAVEIGGKDLATAVGAGGLGGSFTVDSNTEITVTAGAGEVTRGTIVVKDGVGNSSAETIFKGTIDNTDPATPTIGLEDWNDYGYSNTDNWTSINHADFDVRNVVSGDLITVYMDGVAVLSQMIAGGSADSGRNLWWDASAEIQGDELAAGKDGITGGDGDYTFTAIATDSAGNASTAGTMTYKLDMTDPAAPVLESFSSSASAVGVDESGTDKITNDNTPSIRVSNITVGNGVRLYYYLRGSADNDWESVQFDLAGDTLTSAPFDVQIVGTLEKNWGDQTQGVIAALPDSADNVGDFKFHEYNIYGSQIDSAGNSESSGWSTFYVDTKDPQTTLSYSTVNALTTLAEDPDSLMRFEDGQLTIKATFTDASGNPDGMNNTTPPTVTVDLPETTDDDIANAAMTVDPANDHIWTYTFTPPDGIDGSVTVTVNGTDNAGNALVTASTVGTQVMVFDNTDPIPFTMGKATPMGENPKVGYFNLKTDSLSAIVPMDASDQSLGEGQVKLTMQILGNDASKTQVDTTIKITNYSQPLTIFTKKDSIRRNFSKTAGPPWKGETMVKGSKFLIMAEIFDKAGNSTLGSASADTMVIDTIPPVKGAASFVTGNVVGAVNDTIISTDSVKVTWSSFFEDTLQGETGINRYEWALEDEVGPAKANVMPFTSVSTDTSAAVRDTLTHNTRYNVLVRAVDEAGNNSDSLSLKEQDTNGFLRMNTAPVLAVVDSQEVDEDIQFTYLLTATEPDTATLAGDTLHFTILDTGIVNPTNKPTIDEYTGVVTWNTPTQKDSGSYTLRIRVEDEWLIPGGTTNMADTLDFVLTVNSVNDTPVVAAASDVGFLEDVMNGDTLSLTPLVTDVDDNDTTQIIWSAVVNPDNKDYPAYPSAFFYDPGATIDQKMAIRRFMMGNDDASPQGSNQSSEGSFSGGPAEKLRVVIDTTQTLTRAFFVADSNYYVVNRKVTLIATDRYGASDSTSLLVTIAEINDKPRLANIVETTMWEGDTLEMVIVATDIDDDTVTFNVIPDSASRLNVTVKDSLLTIISQDLPGTTNKSRWSKSTKVLVVASDPDTSDSTTFTLQVKRLPRPAPWLYLGENVTFARFYEMTIVDTAKKALGIDLTINPIGAQVKFDSLGSYTWVANYEFDTTGVTFDYVIKARAKHGDTLVTRSSQFALARAREDWMASSADGDFKVIGKRGAVTYDKPFAIVDSLLFPVGGRDGGLYRMGHPLVMFKKAVMVSLPVDPSRHPDDQAIHRKGRSSVWEELPSITKGDQILAWTDEMGYFKRGKKTLIVPEETSIGNNYPNPFNSQTRFRFDVGIMGGPDQRINVAVYNLLGQRVKTLHNGPIGIGQHELAWHGLNDRGVPVSSGIYVLRMVGDSSISQTKKMMLMK